MKIKFSIIALFIMISVYSQGVLTPVDKLKIRMPASMPTASEVIVRNSSSGETGTILKTDLVDVIEAANASVLPATGNIGKIYCTLDNNKLFRWNGTIYVEISPVSGTDIKTLEGQSLLGSGNIDLVKADVGLSNVDNTSDVNKPISTATQTALNLKANQSSTYTKSEVDSKISNLNSAYHVDFIDSGTHNFTVPDSIIVQNVYLNNIPVYGADWSQTTTTVNVTTSITGDKVTLTGGNFVSTDLTSYARLTDLTSYARLTDLFNTDNSVSWDGTISFNQITKDVAITAGTVFTKDGYKGATTNESVTVPSGDFIIVYLDNALALHYAPFYSYDKSPTNIILARLDTNGTNVINVNYCLIRDYIIDGVIYKGNLSPLAITTPINFKESAENKYKIVDVVGTKQMQILAGAFFLSDKSVGSNGFVAFSSQNITFSLDYNYLFFNYDTGVFTFAFYTTVSQADFDHSICLGLFYVTDTKVWAITSSGIGYSYNDVVLKSSEVYIPNGIKYGELGDSITAQDNKNGGSYVGYGYGQRICKELKIPYANHYPEGKNGHTTADIAYLITNGLLTFPSDINLFTVFLGTNDWGIDSNNMYIGTPSDYINDTYTETGVTRTSYGAMRKIIDYLSRAKSTTILDHAQIVLFTPMLRGSFGYKSGGVIADYMKSSIDSTGAYTTNAKGFTLAEVADMVKWVAQYEGLACVDLFYDGFIQKRFLNTETVWTNWATEDRPLVYQDLLWDNLHPDPDPAKPSGYNLLFSRVIIEVK